ncbi:MAG: hypothetical protein WBZ23_01885 [Pseudolabrys sp.]
MTAAYDTAIAKLNIKSSDPLTGKLAAAIAAVAAEGERDPGTLELRPNFGDERGQAAAV